ncbi:unnamed protein product [Coffea canephora]|uniref:DH200=94 genomic scaffold, scaffold_163 n=1 Tax=Coffea canephora TaxID=49390 RepID=A0A068VA87_COFCA|nr:unnamed protein product [Coffea canephora]
MFPHSTGSIYSYRSILCPDLVLLVLVRSRFGSSVLCYKFLPRTVDYVKSLNKALRVLKEEQVTKMFGPYKSNHNMMK